MKVGVVVAIEIFGMGKEGRDDVSELKSGDLEETTKGGSGAVITMCDCVGMVMSGIEG